MKEPKRQSERIKLLFIGVVLTIVGAVTGQLVITTAGARVVIEQAVVSDTATEE